MTSLFEIFKIGIGPSSSHTVGPMIAAKRFLAELGQLGLLAQTNALRVDLYGSLALTGKGHRTDVAIILGLLGNAPETVDTQAVESMLATVRSTGQLALTDKHLIPFDEGRDIVFHGHEKLPMHSNGMLFSALNAQHKSLLSKRFYSIGGGFVVTEGEAVNGEHRAQAPFPFHSAAELLETCRKEDAPIWKLIYQNECALRPGSGVTQGINRIWKTMQDCMARGMTTAGILPGGLNVRRRAPGLAIRLSDKDLKAEATRDPLAPFDWVMAFAMAVNEENAAGGRIVTAPTNGAAGIIPAVAHYYTKFIPDANDEGILRFFLTATAIGSLYKENASISGAEVGCQGEVGVAASMAAGALVAALNGTNEQIEHAAEIAMEHNLGMTCDPIGGLVQIPCIERNAMGAIKAINACRLAMNEPDGHKISLDRIIATMYRTGLDMQAGYKETSLAGLALYSIEC